MGKKKKLQTQKTVLFEDSSEDDKILVKTETTEVKFECPMCKQMLEIQNQMEINKRGNCKCSCAPFSFKVNKGDKTMRIDKKADGDINVKTDEHDITIRWGRQATPSDDNNETVDTVKAIMESRTPNSLAIQPRTKTA